jgi:hypothetical protein
MEELLSKVPSYVELGALFITSLVIVASVGVRFTKSTKDDAYVGKVANFFIKLFSYLPTLGLNPQTKKLEEAYKELRERFDKKQ